MFKTLASFFKPEKKAEEGAPAEEPKKDPENEPEDDPKQEPEEDPKGEPNEDPEDGGEANASISTERYNALLAAEAELKKFGATADARAGFLAEVKQLYTWYNNVKAVGIKGAVADASAEKPGKGKAVSSVTKEAREMEAKRAGK